jgi:hypothetical protein
MAKPKPLPKRFQPLANQAATETAIRYGGQESALASVLGQLTHDYSRQSQAQADAGQSVLGALHGAGDRLTQTYSDAGLTPALLAQIGNSPTGQRLAGELASGKADLQQQLLGDVGKVNSQLTSEQQERGLYQSSLLDQLISGDRSARHDANLAAAKQQHADLQAQLDRQSSLGNALIGQGLAPVLNPDGSVTVGSALPGGKADPNAPANKPKPKAKPTATPQEMQQASGQFGAAIAALRTLDPDKTERRQDMGQYLLAGHKPQPIYMTETIPGKNGQPDKVTRRPKLSGDVVDKKTGKAPAPGTGSPLMTPAVPATQQVLASAALDMYYNGYLSQNTIKQLHALGYKVRGLPNVKTAQDVPSYNDRVRSGTAAGPLAPGRG